MLTFGNTYLNFGGAYLTGWESHKPPTPTVYNVILNQTIGGTISAVPMSGINGTTVTLSNSPDTNYTFNGYTISGSTLYNTNKFDINDSDVTCSASWTYIQPIPWDTVTIGNQTWSKDININDGGSGITVYNNKVYYTYDAAIRIAKYVRTNYTSWRLATQDDWGNLIVCSNINSITGPKSITTLRSKSGWSYGNGTNNFGFNITNNGYYMYSSSTKKYTRHTEGTRYWTLNTGGSTGTVQSIEVDYNVDESRYKFNYSQVDRNNKYNIRLVKDVV